MQLEESRQTRISLSLLKKGGRGRVVALMGDATTQSRLRELGVYELAEIAVLHVNGSVLCQVNDSRFGLDRQIAESVLVEPFS
jgi:Fe2+ transport system protein FeoA